MKNIVHYCQHKKMWTSHTYKSCAKAPSVLITGGWSTEIKPQRKTNPRGWVVADHTQVHLNPDDALLEAYSKAQPLVYDKHNMRFNVEAGEAILFDDRGAYILQEVAT